MTDELRGSARQHSALDPDALDTFANPPITLLGLLNGLLRQRRLIIVVALVCGLFAMTRSLMTPRSFAATASFSPSAPSSSSKFSGLASEFGVDLQTDASSQSPAFYADLLKSRPLLQTVVKRSYVVTEDGQKSTKTLIQVFGASGDTPAVRLERAVIALRSAMLVTLSQKTGVITFVVKARTPELAAQIGQTVLSAINEFNVASRQGSASQERQFTERRVNEVRGELSAAEERLLSFQQRNRSLTNDPALQMQQSQLSREVDRLQGLYASLSQSYESARIDEVRDTPAITVIEHPENSVLPVGRGTVRNTLVSFVLGLFLGVLLAFIREVVARNQASDPAENDEFGRLRDEIISDLRLRRLSRPSHSRS